MATNMIEVLNIKRQKFLLMQIIGLFLFLPGSFIGPFVLGTVWNVVLACLAIPGLALFLYSTFKTKSILTLMRGNPELNGALNSDYYRLCDYKAFVGGFYAMIVAMIILYFIVGYWAIPTRIIIGIIIFTGVLTTKIIQFILKRN